MNQKLKYNLFLLLSLICILCTSSNGQGSIINRESITSEHYGVNVDKKSIVQNDDNIFLLIEDVQGDFINIGSDIIMNDTLSAINIQESDLLGQTVLAKFDYEFNLETHIKFKNVAVNGSTVSYINDEIFLLVNTQIQKRIFINNELFEFNDDEYSVIFKFDNDLNLIDYSKFNLSLNLIKENNGYLVAVGSLNSQTSTSINVNGNMIEGYYYLNDNDKVYVGNTPIVLSLDIEELTPIVGWRIGSTSDSYITDFQIDEEGSVYLIGRTNSLNWINFSDSDSLLVATPTGESFIAKYNSEGDLNYASVTDFNSSDQLRQIEVSEDGIFISGEFRNETLNWEGYELENITQDDSRGFQKAFVSKLNSDFQVEWLYGIPGKQDISLIRDFKIAGDEMILTTWAADGSLVLGDIEINLSKLYMSSTVLQLNSVSGSLDSYIVFDGASNENLVEYYDNKNKFLIHSITNSQEIFDLEYGRNGYRDLYLSEVKNDLFISVVTSNLTLNNESRIKIFPNPTMNEITVESDVGYIGDIELYTINGEKVSVEMPNKFEHNHKIDMSNLANGIYVVQYTVDNIINKQKIIKQ